MLVVLRPEAEGELLEAQAWYESKALETIGDVPRLFSRLSNSMDVPIRFEETMKAGVKATEVARDAMRGTCVDEMEQWPC